MRKIYIIPNFVTTLGMFFGFFSVVGSVKYDFVLAAWSIGVAAVFDMLDGRIARLARATSTFGVEYDSLSDLISFGLAPSILIFIWALEPFGRLGWLVAFLFVACGALRLARFNIMTHTIPKSHFQGLPIPIAAMALATFVIFNDYTQWPGQSGDKSTQIFSLILTLLLSALMVSTVPFPSFKELNWRSRASFGYIIMGIAGLVLIAIRHEFALFTLIIAYVLVGLLASGLGFFRSKKKVPARHLVKQDV